MSRRGTFARRCASNALARDLLNAHHTSQPASSNAEEDVVRRLTSSIISLPIVASVSTVTLVASDPVDVARRLLGRPYVWGGAGPEAFDCSGLVQYVFGQFGIDLPRRAVQQSEVGEQTRGRLRRGDLVFFATDARHPRLVTHVGIYEAAGTMIDASSRYGTVRRDDLDDEYWTARFLFATRLDGDSERREEPDRLPDDERTRRSEPDSRKASASRVLRRAAEEFARRILQRPGF